MVMPTVNHQVGSISRISTNPNNGRASHYHLHDGHTILILEGQIEIYERPVGSSEVPNKVILNKGDLHFTGPMVEHYMWMPCYTVFDCYSLLPRDQKMYENETVRFEYDLKEMHENSK